jgi:hypothetical protein
MAPLTSVQSLLVVVSVWCFDLFYMDMKNAWEMLNLLHGHNTPSHEGRPHTLGPTLM